MKIANTVQDLVARVFPRFVGFTLSGLNGFFFLLIGHCDYFGFGFTALNHKVLKMYLHFMIITTSTQKKLRYRVLSIGIN